MTNDANAVANFNIALDKAVSTEIAHSQDFHDCQDISAAGIQIKELSNNLSPQEMEYFTNILDGIADNPPPKGN